MALMKEEAVEAVIEGMKAAGIGVVTSLPTHQIVNLRNSLEDDPDLNFVPVANEGDAVGICSGAWLGGNLGALVAQENGMILATYHLLGTMDHFGGFPMVMFLDMPGHFSFREYAPPHMYYYAHYAPKVLEALQFPFTTITEIDRIGSTIQSVVNAARGMMRPAGVILAGNLYS